VDSATLLGVIGGSLLVMVAIFLGGDVGLFFNTPSLLLVVGGTAATIFIRYPMSDVLGTLRIVRQAFFFEMKSTRQKSSMISSRCRTPPAATGSWRSSGSSSTTPFWRRASASV
jgi:flagellar motor component MotA